MTEVGDAELTEQNVMALSGHKTPDAAHFYVKRTEKQRAIARRQEYPAFPFTSGQQANPKTLGNAGCNPASQRQWGFRYRHA
jgi:hypothetical protein